MNPQQQFWPIADTRFPWLTREQVSRLEQVTSNFTWLQKLQKQQELYQQAIKQIQANKNQEDRVAAENEKYCRSLSKDTKEMTTDQCSVRLEQLADTVKNYYGLNPNVDTNTIVDWLVKLNKQKKVDNELLNKYLDSWDKEYLYQMGFEKRPEEWNNIDYLKIASAIYNPVWTLATEAWKYFGEHPAEITVWAAQSPWKWWYNLIWQWIDRAWKSLAWKLEWTDLANFVRQSAIDMFWEDEVRKYAEQKQQELKNWTAFNGRDATDIRTPLLWDKANSTATQIWETVWDIWTAIALSYPMAAATASSMWINTATQAWRTLLMWAWQWAADMAAYELWANNRMASPTEMAVWWAIWAAAPFVVPMFNAATKAVSSKYWEIMNTLRASSKEKLRSNLVDLFSRWIKPSSAWIKSTSAQEKIYDDAMDAVETIIWNKNNLRYVTQDWEEIYWKLPTNTREFAQALEQSKRDIYNQYNAITQWAWEKIEINTEWLIDELLKLKNDKAAMLGNQWLENAIDSWLNWLKEVKSLTPSQVQQKMQEINKKLEAFYKNPNPNDVSWNSVDALVKNWLSKEMDNAIETALWNSSEYEALKRAYASLKTIEKDVNHRAIVSWRQSPNSLVDSIADISSAENIIDMLTSPTAWLKVLWKQALKKYIKSSNSSDNMVKKLFEKAEKELERSWTLKTRQQILKQQQQEYERWLNQWADKNYLPFIEWADDAWKTVIPWGERIAVTPEWNAVREGQINEVNNIKNIDDTNKIVNEDWTRFIKSNEWNAVNDKLAAVREKAYKNVDTVMEEAKANWLEPWTAEYDKVVWEKLYNEFKDSFDDLLAEHMKNNPEKANLIDPDELRYLVNDNQRLPAWITHPIVKELAERQYKKVVSELMKSWKKNALVMWWWSWAWKWFVRKHYKLAENWFQDWRPADIIVDKVSWVEEANELVKKWFDVQQYWVIPRAENVVLNISQRAFEQWRWLSIPKVWREAHLRFVDQFLNWRPNKWSVSPLELYVNSLNWDWKYRLKLLWLRDKLVEVPWEWWFTKYVPEEWWKWAVEIPMSEWRKALEDYEKEIWVELSNDKIEKVVKEKFLDTWKIDKARYKELVTWISWLLLLWLANLGAEKEEA